MRILITGGCGFIGSHLADHLIGNGHSIVVLDDLSTGSLDNLSAAMGSGKLRFVNGSILDSKTVDTLVADSDYVFHLASVVGVKLVCDAPIRTIDAIVGGTCAVVRACSRHGKPIFVASTSEVYGKSTSLPFREDADVVLGSTSVRRWSYAYCKAVDEFTALAYHREHGLPVVVARFFNTVGPRQTGAYGMVVPRFVKAAVSGKPLTVYGSGNQSRCFCHVSDVVRAVASLALECPSAIGRVVNIGDDHPISINSLADIVLQVTGSHSTVVRIPYSEAYPDGGFEDMMCRVPCLDTVRSLIGFKCTHDIRDVIVDVNRHIRENGISGGSV